MTVESGDEKGEATGAEPAPEPLTARMLDHVETVFGPLGKTGQERLFCIKIAATDGEEALRKEIAEAFRDQLAEITKDEVAYRSLVSFAKRSCRAWNKGEADSLVGGGMVKALEDIAAFREAKGSFSGPDPMRVTPAERSFIGWVRSCIRSAWGKEMRDTERMEKIRTNVQWRLTEDHRQQVAAGSEAQVGRPSDADGSTFAHGHSGVIGDPGGVIGARRELLRAARTAVTSAVLDSPDILARGANRQHETRDIARSAMLEFLTAIEREDGSPDRATHASGAPDLVGDCLRRVLSPSFTGDALDQRVHRHRADAAFACSTALSVAVALPVDGADDPGAFETARWNLQQWAIAIDLDLVEHVTALVGSRITADLSEKRFAADLIWLDALVRHLTEETAESQRIAAVRPALDWLEKPLKKNPSPIEQAQGIIDAGGAKADDAMQLISVWERMCSIVGEPR